MTMPSFDDVITKSLASRAMEESPARMNAEAVEFEDGADIVIGSKQEKMNRQLTRHMTSIKY